MRLVFMAGPWVPGKPLVLGPTRNMLAGEWSGGGGGGTWGTITGVLSDQTDLQDALDDKEVAGAAATAVGAHEAAADPHPQYLTPAEADATYQDLDNTLTALAALDASAGLVEQTGVDAFTKRALGVGASTSIPTRADADARYAPIGGSNSFFPSGWL
jgi:hypothetical protein